MACCSGLVRGAGRVVRRLRRRSGYWCCAWRRRIRVGRCCTPMRPRLGVGGGLKYVHVACTPVLTLSHVGGRSKADIDAGQVLPGFTGALVRDGYAAYRHLAMRQSEEGLTAGIEATPPGSPLLTVGANALGEVVRGPAGQRNRGGVAQHGEAPVWGFESWSAVSYLERRIHRQPALTTPGSNHGVRSGPLLHVDCRCCAHGVRPGRLT